MEDGRKKVKQWNSKKIISCLIVSVLLIAAGTGSVFAYNFIQKSRQSDEGVDKSRNDL